MPECLDDLLRQRPPTPERPLEGQTVLVIEDSRFASEALRLLSIRSGARVRRADSIRTASRHLATYRPSVVIIDMGLPDGDGAGLVRALAGATPRIPVILAISGHPEMEEVALEAGADGFIAKPLTSIALFQQKILGAMPENLRPTVLRAVHREDRIVPDRIALRDDLAEVQKILDDETSPETLDYVARFIAGLGRVSGDAALAEAAQALSAACRDGGSFARELREVEAQIAARLSGRETV